MRDVWPPRWMFQKGAPILIPVGGAVLLGGAGWLLGWPWAVAGVLVGAVAAVCVLVTIFARSKPDPFRLLAAGRPREAYRQVEYDLSFARRLAARQPMFRDMLADKLDMMSQVQRALGNEPGALEAAAEATAIWTELAAKRPFRYTPALTGAQLQQAALLAAMGRHGEALAAIEPAVRAYRRMAVSDRSAYLPLLAAALTRQADELGYLDRITEARAAAAEAEMIGTDMLPSAHSWTASPPPGSPATDAPAD